MRIFLAGAIPEVHEAGRVESRQNEMTKVNATLGRGAHKEWERNSACCIYILVARERASLLGAITARASHNNGIQFAA